MWKLAVLGQHVGIPSKCVLFVTFVSVFWWFPKIRGTILGFPIVRTLVFWGPNWASLILETTIYIGDIGTPHFGNIRVI